MKNPEKKSNYTIEEGSPHPLGAMPDKEGVNFSIFSEHATSVELLLFDEHDHAEPVQVISFDTRVNKTFHFWHVYVRDLKPGMHYAYRIDGPQNAKEGHRFNPNKILLDPYSKGITNNLWKRADACHEHDNIKTSLRCALIDLTDYDWEGDKPLNHPMHETIVYEMHVGGFTASPDSGVKHKGTFYGVIEKIPYLKKLGITTVELLPVMQFDNTTPLRYSPDGKPLVNYWGYSTIGFFSPHSGYCAMPQDAQHIKEFRDMVKAFHKADIEVILDIVFNHTEEGNHQGPVFSFKGIDNQIYYLLNPENREYYMDYSGCGNTVNCNHPIVDKFILECLEFWVREMHVDGFRFDEGSILSRGMDGAPMSYPPVVWHIELSEELADSKIIAEAWDAAGLYQVGYFPGYRWAEWNGRFRDDIRRFVRGDSGLVGAVASRISGSSDIYQSSGHLPMNSINFISCHDGFTLNDMVSYNLKHNSQNGENNRDGVDENFSWNCGTEGETENPEIEKLRNRQIKNFATILLISQGVPMLLAGDEVRRTQHGNNNAYCQNNELNWFDWSCVEKHKDIFHYFQKMIALRKKYRTLHRQRFFTGELNEFALKDIAWHGCKLNQPGWNDPNARVLAFTLAGFEYEPNFHIMMNMFWEPVEFEIPVIKNHHWLRVADTSLLPPEDFSAEGKEKQVKGTHYLVGDRSIVILISKKN